MSRGPGSTRVPTSGGPPSALEKVGCSQTEVSAEGGRPFVGRDGSRLAGRILPLVREFADRREKSGGGGGEGGTIALAASPAAAQSARARRGYTDPVSPSSASCRSRPS